VKLASLPKIEIIKISLGEFHISCKAATDLREYFSQIKQSAGKEGLLILDYNIHEFEDEEGGFTKIDQSWG